MAQVFTGARGLVRVGDTDIGFMTGINVNVEYTLTDVDVLGKLETGDFAETGVKVTFSANTFKAINVTQATVENPIEGVPEGTTVYSDTNSAGFLGIDKSYRASATGVAPASVGNMRAQNYFDVQIVDDQNESKPVVFMLKDCKFEGGSGQMDARGIWQGTWNFKAKAGFGL